MNFLVNLARRGREHPGLVRPRVRSLFEPPTDGLDDPFVEREVPSEAPPRDRSRTSRPASPGVAAAVGRQAARAPRAGDAVGQAPRPKTVPQQTVSRAAAPPPPAQREAPERPNVTRTVAAAPSAQREAPKRPRVAAQSTSDTDEPTVRSPASLAELDAPARAVASLETSSAPADPPPQPPLDMHTDADDSSADAHDSPTDADDSPADAHDSPADADASPLAPATTPDAAPVTPPTRISTPKPMQAPDGPSSLLVVNVPPDLSHPANAGPDGSPQLVAGQPLVVRARPAPATQAGRRTAARTGLRGSGSPAPAPLTPLALDVDAPEPAPAVHVTIGRIEVRATTAPPQRVARQQVPEPMSLEEHLRQRAGGGR